MSNIAVPVLPTVVVDDDIYFFSKRIATKHTFYKSIITLLVILCIFLLYNFYGSSSCGLSPSRRKKDLPYTLLYLNEQMYYKSLRNRDKKKYGNLDSDEKLDAILSNLEYQLST